MPLIDFLTDTVVHMSHFKDDLNIVYLFEENKRLIACANHSKMMLLYRITPSEDLSQELAAPMYCGALPYLNSLLTSPLMKSGDLQIEYQEKDGKKTFAKSMRFRSVRMDAKFECTNPEILNTNDRRTQFDKFKDAVIFSFTKDMRKEFDEVARMSTPKADSRMFTLIFDGTYIRAIFGSGTHTTSLILTDQVTGNTETKIQKLISADRFRPMIKLVSDNAGQVHLHDRALYVSFDTSIANHLIVTPTIRPQQ